jgi:DNA-binding response OmpR family regulator
MIKAKAETVWEGRPLLQDVIGGAVLVASRDEFFRFRSATALEESGFEVITASSPATAECRLKRRNVWLVILDGRILGPVSEGRPGPILPASLELPLVVTNARSLDSSQRALVASYGARCVDEGGEAGSLIRAVRESLLEHFGPTLGAMVQTNKEGKILLLDDSYPSRSWLAEALRDDGYTVWEYRSPVAVPALSGLRGVALVVTEYWMDGEDGLLFADRVHTECPTMPILMVSAHWGEDFAAELRLRDFLCFLRKPLDRGVLREVIRDLIRSQAQYRPRGQVSPRLQIAAVV